MQTHLGFMYQITLHGFQRCIRIYMQAHSWKGVITQVDHPGGQRHHVLKCLGSRGSTVAWVTVKQATSWPKILK